MNEEMNNIQEINELLQNIDNNIEYINTILSRIFKIYCNLREQLDKIDLQRYLLYDELVKIRAIETNKERKIELCPKQ